VFDQMLNSDPIGELTIEVPEDEAAPPVTVLAVTFDSVV
jgi:hypothetical protein